MTKYQINYNRSVPDHRVPFDYEFVRSIKGPLDYWKVFFIFTMQSNIKVVLIIHGLNIIIFI